MCLLAYPLPSFLKECMIICVNIVYISTTCYSCGLSTATIEYSCPSVFLCVCVRVCFCVCVCVHDNSKNNGSIHLKLEHIIVYENSSDEFDIGHRPIKVKVTLKFFSICHNTNCQVLYLSFGTC